MDDNKLTFKQVDDLSNQLKVLLLSLETQIDKIYSYFSTCELDFMYGNITEDIYLDRMLQVSNDIAKFKDKLKKLQELDNNLR